MILIAFACFALLVVAWMMAPTEKARVTKPAPAPIQVGDLVEAVA